MTNRIEFRAKLWLYPGPGGWHFVSLPRSLTPKIRAVAPRSGWGSVRVVASIGDTTWGTSIFPDSKTRSYLLPVKADVRRKEKLETNGIVDCRVEILTA